MRDFTLQKYTSFLEGIVRANIPVYGVRTWLKEQPERGLLIRHDVDRRAHNSLRMAELEASFGVKSTYYFRVTRGSFNPKIIQQIANKGHEIGYHYEDLATAKGDTLKALNLFEKNLKRFQGLAEVRTIAMHGSPLSPYNNQNLWEGSDFKPFGIEAEAFLSIDYSGVYYITDTGRTWAETSFNLRDRVPNSYQAPIASTDELLDFVTKHPTKKIAVICHPERWDDNWFYWGRQLIKDQLANSIKWCISHVRK